MVYSNLDFVEAALYYDNMTRGEISSDEGAKKTLAQLKEYRERLKEGLQTYDRFRGIAYTFLEHPIIVSILSTFRINLNEYRNKPKSFKAFETDISAWLDSIIEIFEMKDNFSPHHAVELRDFCLKLGNAELNGRADSRRYCFA